MSFIRNVLVALLCLIGFQIANAAWTKQESGTFAWLRSVYFLNEQRGWIVGSNGVFLATVDGGTNWKIQEKFTKDDIRDIYFLDGQIGWLLCERSIHNIGRFSRSYVLQTTDGGLNWRTVELPIGQERIVRFFFTTNGTGFGIGEGSILLRLEENKADWKKYLLPVLFLMQDGTFIDHLSGAVVGAGGTILVTRDGGVTWNAALLVGQNVRLKLNAIYFADNTRGWTVGSGGSIYFTSDKGQYWHHQSSNVTENLNDVYFRNRQEGYAVGDNGIVLHTTSAGESWKKERTGTKSKLEKVLFIGERGFAVGFGGTILRCC